MSNKQRSGSIKICSVDGCLNATFCKGICKKHYNHLYRYGKILNRTIQDKNEIIIKDNYAEIVLYNRTSQEVGRALIDKNYIEKIKKHKWGLSSGYAMTTIKGKCVFLHRFLYGKMMDHIFGNKLDNRSKKVRSCTYSQNSMNACVSKNNTSGVTGVYWNARSCKWFSQITVKGKTINLGVFTKKITAISARKEAKLLYFKEFRNKRDEKLYTSRQYKH